MKSGVFCGKKESEYPARNGYKLLKDEILRIFKQGEEVAFERAMGRVMSGTPSQLARALVNDLCDHNLRGCCCKKFIFGLWRRSLPSGVKAGIAHIKFSAETFNEILDLADKIWSSNRPPVIATSVAAVADQSFSQPPPSVEAPLVYHNPDMAFHPAYNSQMHVDPEVAALAFRGGFRGQGRGYFRGQGWGRGQNSGYGRFNGGNNRGGRGFGGRGGGSGGGQPSQAGGQAAGDKTKYSKQNPRHTTPRHSDLPPFGVCKKHWDHGKSAKWCLEPKTCEWKNFTTQ